MVKPELEVAPWLETVYDVRPGTMRVPDRLSVPNTTGPERLFDTANKSFLGASRNFKQQPLAPVNYRAMLSPSSSDVRTSHFPLLSEGRCPGTLRMCLALFSSDWLALSSRSSTLKLQRKPPVDLFEKLSPSFYTHKLITTSASSAAMLKRYVGCDWCRLHLHWTRKACTDFASPLQRPCSDLGQVCLCQTSSLDTRISATTEARLASNCYQVRKLGCLKDWQNPSSDRCCCGRYSRLLRRYCRAYKLQSEYMLKIAQANFLRTVKFDGDQLPPILNALETDNGGQKLILEVAVWHIHEDTRHDQQRLTAR